MAMQEVELKELIRSDSPELNQTETSALDDIVLTQQSLSNVRDSLEKIIDGMAKDQSLVTRAAIYWGEIPIWQRVVYGTALALPTLAGGVIAHLALLYTISGFTLASYTAGGLILDDHHKYNIDVVERLKKGIFSLADVLQLTINTLETISNKFKAEIDKFAQENVKLTTNVDTLTQQMHVLSQEINSFIDTKKFQQELLQDLEAKGKALEAANEQQSALIEANCKEMDIVKQQYNTLQVQLSDKVSELDKVRDVLGAEISRAKLVANTLQGTVKNLVNSKFEDAEKQKAFYASIDSMTKMDNQLFNTMAESFHSTEKELSKVKAELQEKNDRLEELVQRQEAVTENLEAINAKLIAEQRQPNTKLAEILSSRGFYGIHKKIETPMDERSQLCIG